MRWLRWLRAAASAALAALAALAAPAESPAFNILQSLAQIMARRLVDAKPLSEPMLQYCKSLHWEIVIDIHKFSFKK